jgi:hypothetical protein
LPCGNSIKIQISFYAPHFMLINAFIFSDSSLVNLSPIREQ